MTTSGVLAWLHLIGMAVWIGGTITVGMIVPALRRAGATSEHLRAMARAFGRALWASLGVLVATGIGQLVLLEPDTVSKEVLGLKLLLVGVAVSLALVHQMTARTMSPAGRGVVQVLILAASLGILGAAVGL